MNLVAYVTATSVDGGTPVLRRSGQIATAYGGASTFRHIVLNLGLSSRTRPRTPWMATS